MAAGYYPIYLDCDSDILDTYGEHIAAITQGHSDNSVVRALLSPFYVLADIGRAATRIPVVWANQLGSGYPGRRRGYQSTAAQETLAADTTQPSAAFVQQRWAAGSHGKALAEIYTQLLDAQKNADEQQAYDKQHPHSEQHAYNAIHIYIGPDFDVNSWHLFAMGAVYVVTIPTKIITEPLIDWLGTPSWQDMSRRTLMRSTASSGSPLNMNLKLLK